MELFRKYPLNLTLNMSLQPFCVDDFSWVKNWKSKRFSHLNNRINLLKFRTYAWNSQLNLNRRLWFMPILVSWMDFYLFCRNIGHPSQNKMVFRQQKTVKCLWLGDALRMGMCFGKNHLRITLNRIQFPLYHFHKNILRHLPRQSNPRIAALLKKITLFS